jgi:hypothetical protein
MSEFLKYTYKGADEVHAMLEETRVRILVGLRLGIREALFQLKTSWIEAAAPHFKSAGEDDSLQAILGRTRPHLVESESELKGFLRPKNKGLQPHYWLEFGVKHPAVEGKLMAFDPGEGMVFSHGEKAYTIAPNPIFEPTFQQCQAQMIARIEKKIEDVNKA